MTTENPHKTSQQTIELKQASLAKLPAAIEVPNYDRSKLSAGIVHIGVGGFHRAHQAMYIDQLLQQPGNEQWAICGVGLLEANRELAQILKQQDYLYTLIVRHPNGTVENRVIGAMIDFLFAPDSQQAVIDKLASETTKVVSLTITEGGYHFNPATGEFDGSHPDIQHDALNPAQPKTTFGYLAAGLKARRDAGLKPFTVQSCDNIQHNGAVTRKMLLAFIELFDTDLARWVAEHVSFPNGMVDRITPVTTDNDINYLAHEFAIDDRWPITCEAFSQWVIEDDFCNGRPDWDRAGGQFVTDVTPYEKMKIRLLNAGHSVLGLLGAIHGFATIDEAVCDLLFARYLRTFMDDEVTPLLDALPGIDLTAYKDTLIERFSNPNIKDSLARICLQSSAKLPKFLIATVQENLSRVADSQLDYKAECQIELATLVLASWCLYSDKRVDQHGNALEISDDMAQELHHHAANTQADPLAFLAIEDLFGDLKHNATFSHVYRQCIARLYAPNLAIKTLMEDQLSASVEVE
ncbi:mannitol dehydrogenase family protein [Neiella marina]|uniref:Mannitol dehydrogenase family protein n=1 Tax=Neiella holothuriorum TaxID=2870530 RepID=A0ABS7EFA1_9GAMM|nr:mannitol dehydrogenase family protein [Neiella holothuriorum]MBW8190598.1 mannitol dehydrogenase family protein [Neiella holothuriorum]